MSSRELAEEINRRTLYVRPSDGEPLKATQIAARVRRRTYRDRYKIDADHRISLMATRVEDLAPRNEDAQPVRGPHGWLNWYAQSIGQPQREAAHPNTAVINPIWEEFLFYSDADLRGTWHEFGPYDLIALNPSGPRYLGRARRVLLLRAWDHLSDAPSNQPHSIETDIESYFGGDIGDEVAALLGLALARRVRCGGRVRQGLPPLGDGRPRTLELGLASEQEHQTPMLEPPARKPMIHWLADPVLIEDAFTLLKSYPTLDGSDATALVRAARQYVDALWLADSDPRLAWIKLVSAVEVIANRFDDCREDSHLAQLKRHRKKLYNKLKDLPDGDAEIIAGEIGRLFNAERKFRSFIKRFDPGPPALRPPAGPACFDWNSLDTAMAKLYEHRSGDLHDGIAFPAVMCEPPDEHIGNMPSERFYFLGVSTKGGRWEADDLPMHLHLFAHIAGAAIRKWWTSLASAAVSDD